MSDSQIKAIFEDKLELKDVDVEGWKVSIVGLL